MMYLCCSVLSWCTDLLGMAVRWRLRYHIILFFLFPYSSALIIGSQARVLFVIMFILLFLSLIIDYLPG